MHEQLEKTPPASHHAWPSITCHTISTQQDKHARHVDMLFCSQMICHLESGCVQKIMMQQGSCNVSYSNAPDWYLKLEDGLVPESICSAEAADYLVVLN